MPLPLVVLWSAVLILRCKLRTIQTEIPLRFLFNFFLFYYYRNWTVGKNMKSTMACYLRTKQKIDMPTLSHVRAVIIRLREVILSGLFKCQLSSLVPCREVTFITFNLSWCFLLCRWPFTCGSVCSGWNCRIRLHQCFTSWRKFWLRTFSLSPNLAWIFETLFVDRNKAREV